MKTTEFWLNYSEEVKKFIEENDKVKDVIECLEIRYGWTRLEKLEELVFEWINFREDNYDDEDDLLQAMIEFQRRKEELKVVDKE